MTRLIAFVVLALVLGLASLSWMPAFASDGTPVRPPEEGEQCVAMPGGGDSGNYAPVSPGLGKAYVFSGLGAQIVNFDEKKTIHGQFVAMISYEAIPRFVVETPQGVSYSGEPHETAAYVTLQIGNGWCRELPIGNARSFLKHSIDGYKGFSNDPLQVVTYDPVSYDTRFFVGDTNVFWVKRESLSPVGGEYYPRR